MQPKSFPFLKIFRTTCYCFAVATLVALASMILLTTTGLCTSGSFAGTQSCNAGWASALMGLSVTLLIATVFMGIPAILAVAGVVFFIYEKMKVRMGKQPDVVLLSATSAPQSSVQNESDDAETQEGKQPTQSGPIKYVIYGIATVVGLLLVYGIILGIAGA